MRLTQGERDRVIAAAVNFVEQREGRQIQDCSFTHESFNEQQPFEVVVIDGCKAGKEPLFSMRFYNVTDALAYFSGQGRLL